MSDTLILNGSNLTLEDLYDVVYHGRKVQIDPDVIPRVKAARQVLFDLAATGQPVYGLNHGVGWNKDREFSRTFSSSTTATSSTATLWASPPTAAWRRSAPCCASA